MKASKIVSKTLNKAEDIKQTVDIKQTENIEQSY